MRAVRRGGADPHDRGRRGALGEERDELARAIESGVDHHHVGRARCDQRQRFIRRRRHRDDLSIGTGRSAKGFGRVGRRRDDHHPHGAAHGHKDTQPAVAKVLR